MFNAYVLIKCPIDDAEYTARFANIKTLDLFPDADPTKAYDSENFIQIYTNASIWDGENDEILAQMYKEQETEETIQRYLLECIKNSANGSCFITHHEKYIIVEKGEIKN